MKRSSDLTEKEYPDTVSISGTNYIYEKEIGAGAYGKVHLYRHP